VHQFGGFVMARQTVQNQHELANLHTIKKFELIEAYVKTWAQKLLNFSQCNGIVFIDSMCNSGLYEDAEGTLVYGTPIRVANLLSSVMQDYSQKKATLYFNDLSKAKIDVLRNNLPSQTANFQWVLNHGDGNALLKQMKIDTKQGLHFLLVYDPYQASIDWKALMPFWDTWGELIINHMVSDSIRGVAQARKDSSIAKYEETYQAKIDELIGCNRAAFETKIKEIITAQRQNNSRQYYVSSFPFFNRQNTVVYIIHCTGNAAGFKLYKKTAWQVFGGKSSGKNTRGTEDQLMFDMAGDGGIITPADDDCYYVKDIAAYIHESFKGKKDVPFNDVWGLLELHPIFPSEGFRPEIKQELKAAHNVSISKNTMTFQ